MENMVKKLNVLNWNGDIVSTIDSPLFLTKEFNKALVQEVFHHLGNLRRFSIASTLSRGEVNFSGKKMRPQKRSGRARMGQRGAPHHYKGGVCFGPNGRLYNNKTMPKKKIRSALVSLLSKKVELGELIIMNDFNIPKISTQNLLNNIKTLKLNDSKLVFIDNKDNNNLLLSLRNIHYMDFLPTVALNVYDLFGKKKILISLNSLKELEGLYESK
jgi:large subunit ribosomal protein L4